MQGVDLEKQSVVSLVVSLLKSVAIQFIKSKKFKAYAAALVATVVSYGAALLSSKFGLEIPPEQSLEFANALTLKIVSLTSAYVIGQSVSDATKEKALAESETKPISLPLGTTVRGFETATPTGTTQD